MGYGLDRNPLFLMVGMRRFELPTPSSQKVSLQKGIFEFFTVENPLGFLHFPAFTLQSAEHEKYRKRMAVRD